METKNNYHYNECNREILQNFVYSNILTIVCNRVGTSPPPHLQKWLGGPMATLLVLGLYIAGPKSMRHFLFDIV